MFIVSRSLPWTRIVEYEILEGSIEIYNSQEIGEVAGTLEVNGSRKRTTSYGRQDIKKKSEKSN